MSSLAKIRKAGIASLTQAQARLVSFYDAEQLGEAMQFHGITPEFLLGKLKAILDNDKDPGRQLTALAYLLKLVGESAEKSGLVAEKRIVVTAKGDHIETVKEDRRVMELASAFGNEEDKNANQEEEQESEAWIEGEACSEGHGRTPGLHRGGSECGDTGCGNGDVAEAGAGEDKTVEDVRVPEEED